MIPHKRDNISAAATTKQLIFAFFLVLLILIASLLEPVLLTLCLASPFSHQRFSAAGGQGRLNDVGCPRLQKAQFTHSISSRLTSLLSASSIVIGRLSSVSTASHSPSFAALFLFRGGQFQISRAYSTKVASHLTGALDTNLPHAGTSYSSFYPLHPGLSRYLRASAYFSTLDSIYRDTLKPSWV